MKRRIFIQNSAALLSAAMIPNALKNLKPNTKLRTAHIGVGNMGFEDLKAISSHAQVEVVALCDVDANHLKAASELFPKAKLFKDYREMLNNHSSIIDAVVVSTQDHTHAPASLMAMEHNKPV